MAKKKIKTSRYWTRECPNCGYKYPNWFTNCPKCHSTWNGKTAQETSDQTGQAQLTPLTGEIGEIGGAKGATETGSAGGTPAGPQEVKKSPNFKPIKPNKKTIRIIAQISSEESGIQELLLNFTADGGESWYQMPMVPSEDFYYAEIEDVPLNTTIIYYLKGIDSEGIEFIENNEGEYYYYEVVDYMDQSAGASSNVTDSEPQEVIDNSLEETAQDVFKAEVENDTIPSTDETWNPEDSSAPSPQGNSQAEPVQNSQEKAQAGIPNAFTGATFIPLEQIKKDQNLKECPSCGAKIKKDWSACPICGYKF